jgi:HAE1 family hydrophobic/amphiphilic exporter-1
MTAFASLLGFWPLVVAEGAGAESRQSLGTAIFGGLLVATALSLLIVPILYIVIGTIRDRFSRPRPQPQPVVATPEEKVPSETHR